MAIEGLTGVMLIELKDGTGLTATVTDAYAAGLATLVAVTVADPGVLEAVNSPVFDMAPEPVADQVTPWLAVPLTVAVTCCVPPVCTLTVIGLMATNTELGGTTVDSVQTRLADPSGLYVTAQLPVIGVFT